VRPQNVPRSRIVLKSEQIMLNKFNALEQYYCSLSDNPIDSLRKERLMVAAPAGSHW